MGLKITAQLADGLKLKPSEADRIWFDDAVPGFGFAGSVVRFALVDLPIQNWRQDPAPSHRRGNGDKGRTCARNSRSASRRGRTRRDPATEKKINQIQAGNAFGKLVGIYLNLRIKELRPRSYVGVKRHLEVNSKPLHVLPLEAVNQRTIAGRLNAVAEENSAVVVNRVRAS